MIALVATLGPRWALERDRTARASKKDIERFMGNPLMLAAEQQPPNESE